MGSLRQDVKKVSGENMTLNGNKAYKAIWTYRIVYDEEWSEAREAVVYYIEAEDDRFVLNCEIEAGSGQKERIAETIEKAAGTLARLEDGAENMPDVEFTDLVYYGYAAYFNRLDPDGTARDIDMGDIGMGDVHIFDARDASYLFYKDTQEFFGVVLREPSAPITVGGVKAGMSEREAQNALEKAGFEEKKMTRGVRGRRIFEIKIVPGHFADAQFIDPREYFRAEIDIDGGKVKRVLAVYEYGSGGDDDAYYAKLRENIGE